MPHANTEDDRIRHTEEGVRPRETEAYEEIYTCMSNEGSSQFNREQLNMEQILEEDDENEEFKSAPSTMRKIKKVATDSSKVLSQFSQE